MTTIQRVDGSTFELLRLRDGDCEFWSARDLMMPLGYDKWERFEDAVERAMAAASNAGQPQAFSRVREEGTGGRPRTDYRMSRFGAYLLAMNGDPRKPEIAAAQSYFAVRTREAEVARPVPAAPVKVDAAMLRQIAAAMEAKDAALEAKDVQIAELEPKADLADTFLTSDGSDRLVREVAKLLSMRERDLWRFLVDERLLFVKHAACGATMYDFYAAFAHHFVAKEIPVQHTFGTCSHYTIRVTARGTELIRKRLREAGRLVAL